MYSAVDEHLRCEKWMRDDNVDSKESKTTSWFKRFIGREQKPEVTWPFPFVEGKLFVLTLRAGVDGYHISVGGRHVTSFPYRPVSWYRWEKSDYYTLWQFFLFLQLKWWTLALWIWKMIFAYLMHNGLSSCSIHPLGRNSTFKIFVTLTFFLWRFPWTNLIPVYHLFKLALFLIPFAFHWISSL